MTLLLELENRRVPSWFLSVASWAVVLLRPARGELGGIFLPPQTLTL